MSSFEVERRTRPAGIGGWRGAPRCRPGWTLAAALALPAALALGPGCSRAAERPESVLLITLDTTRADALSCYGGPQGLTPNLDRLARESLVFTQARTVAPLTLPAHASMLTGLYPLRHALRDNGLMPLPAEARTLAEVLRERGVRTAAVVASTVLDRAFALDQGFDAYEQPERPAQASEAPVAELSAAEVSARASRWLAQRDRDAPFFLWAHYFDPHVPYAPPGAFLEAAGGDPYLGEVAAMDAAIGRLLETLRADGTLERTLVVVAGDHGESRGEHGEPTHGALCFDATLRVPLLVRLPGGRGAGRSDRVASVADVHPTVLRALGFEPAEDLDGVDLLAPAGASGRGVYFESYSGFLNYGWSPLAGWADAQAKYLASSEPQLYVPRDDPRERVDRIDAPPVEVERYRAAIEALARRPTLEPASRAFAPEVLDALRSLGYGAMGTAPPPLPHPLAPSDRPAPQARAGELEPLLLANALAAEGRHAEAVPLLEGILAENPANWLAMDYLALDLMHLGRFEAARALLERRTQDGPQRADTRINLALCLERLGQAEGAVEQLRAALAIDPGSPPALAELAQLLERSGRAAEAQALRARLSDAGR